jgi:glycerol-3-phosphate dehydrogenase (NAD+)
MKDKVCIVGSGNWGSAIATIIGPNVIQHSNLFEPLVHMWVYEEMVPLPPSLLHKHLKNGGSNNHKTNLQQSLLPVPNHQSPSSSIPASSTTTTSSSTTTKYKLTDIINTYHENVKYLPNIQLPTNIVATSNISIACNNATLLIFVVPHQFLPNILQQICQSNTININNCRAISLIKGLGTLSIYRYIWVLRYYFFLSTFVSCLNIHSQSSYIHALVTSFG